MIRFEKVKNCPSPVQRPRAPGRGKSAAVYRVGCGRSEGREHQSEERKIGNGNDR